MESDEYSVEGWQAPAGQEPEAQARAWLVRLKSGEATRRDLQALERWRSSSDEHENSYQAELRMWNALGPALRGSGIVRQLPHAASISRLPSAPASRLPSAPLSRRWFLGGATGLAASAVAGIVVLGGNAAPAGARVFETGKGERRHVPLAPGLEIEMNTDSRLYFWPEATPRLTLDRGEAMISVSYQDGRRLLASANLVEITAHKARFVLRDDGGVTRIACLDGDVSVKSDGRGYLLGRDRSLALGEALADPVIAPALEGDAAWQRGMFIFKDRPAGEVVAELNRYRPGHVYLQGGRADVRISGVIHLDRMDLAVDHIAKSLGMKVVRLPADVAILRG